MVARSKAWVCGRSLAGTLGSNPAGEAWTLVCLGVVCCQVQVAALGRSLVQRNPRECGVSECDREAPIMRRSWPGIESKRHRKEMCKAIHKACSSNLGS
jgi:hypothetical protein